MRTREGDYSEMTDHAPDRWNVSTAIMHASVDSRPPSRDSDRETMFDISATKSLPPAARAKTTAFETTEPVTHKPKTARTMTADEGAYQNSLDTPIPECNRNAQNEARHKIKGL